MVQQPDFKSPEELAELLQAVGRRLHGFNRISGGESGYLWNLAEIIRGCGQLAERFAEDTSLREKYGDGYQRASIPEKEQLGHLLEQLKKEIQQNA
jgi:hypothetical protein